MTLENCQIERANAGSGGDVSNVIVQNCTQLVIRSCYFESHTTAGSNDITILGGTSSNVYIDGMFANGNRTANHSIVLPADDTTIVNLTLMQPRLAGYLSDVIANTKQAKKSVAWLSQAGALQLPVGSGPVLLDNGITFQGNGPAINATGGSLYLNYAGGAAGVIIWDGQGGNGHEILRTDPVAHAIRIAGGTNIKRHLSSAGSLTFGSVAAGSTVDRTLTVTGAAIGDSVVVTPSGTMEAGIIWSGYVSAADTITIRLANVTGKWITPVSRSFRADVWKH